MLRGGLSDLRLSHLPRRELGTQRVHGHVSSALPIRAACAFGAHANARRAERGGTMIDRRKRKRALVWRGDVEALERYWFGQGLQFTREELDNYLRWTQHRRNEPDGEWDDPPARSDAT